VKTLIRCFGTFDRALTRALKFVTVVLFVALLGILTVNVAARFVSSHLALEWMDEIVEFCFASLVFYGAAAVWMTKGHFSAGSWITKVCKNPRLVSLYRAGVELASLLFMAVFLKYSLQLTLKSHEVTAYFQIPKAVLYASMPVSAAIMVLYSAGAVAVELFGVFAPED